MGVAGYLERVPLVMDTPVYREMMVSWLSVLAAAMLVLRLSCSKLEHY